MLIRDLVKGKTTTFKHKMINLYQLRAVHHIQHVILHLASHFKVKYKMLKAKPLFMS